MYALRAYVSKTQLVLQGILKFAQLLIWYIVIGILLLSVSTINIIFIMTNAVVKKLYVSGLVDLLLEKEGKLSTKKKERKKERKRRHCS